MQVVWQVEIDKFCNQVLAKRFPHALRLNQDIRTIDGRRLPWVDIICGGFPCQPFSKAGKLEGKSDNRYLWPEMLRIIQEVRPTWVIGENVANIVKMVLDTVLSDLESAGYSCQAFNIPAGSVSAPHKRERIWIVGYNPNNTRETLAYPDGKRPHRDCGVRFDSKQAQSGSCQGVLWW